MKYYEFVAYEHGGAPVLITLRAENLKTALRNARAVMLNDKAREVIDIDCGLGLVRWWDDETKEGAG